MTAVTANRLITEQQYLQMEEKSPVRHEFSNGKMYEVPGESMMHEHIISNLLFTLFRSQGVACFFTWPPRTPSGNNGLLLS